MAKILIIDAIPAVLDTGEKIFKKEGYDVIKAAGAVEGLERAIRELPDLIITDADLPEMNGWDVLKKLKTDPETAGIPVLLYGLAPRDDGEKQAKDSGADGYLQKPYGVDEIRQRAKEIIKSVKEPQETFIKKMENVYDRLSGDSKKTRQEVENLKAMYNDIVMKKLEWERSLWQQQMKIEEDKNAAVVQNLESQKNELSQLVDQKEKRIVELEQELTRKTSEWEERVRSLSEENQAIQESVSDKEGRWHAVSEAKDVELEAIRDELGGFNERLYSILNEKKEQAVNLEKAGRDCDRLKTELQALIKELEAAKSVIEEGRNTIDAQHKDLALQKENYEQLKSLNQRNNSATEVLIKQQTELADAIKQRDEEIEERERQISELKKGNGKLFQELHNSLETSEKDKETIRKYEDETQKLLTDLTKTSEELRKKEAEIRKLSGDKDQLETAEKRRKEQLEAAARENEKKGRQVLAADNLLSRWYVRYLAVPLLALLMLYAVSPLFFGKPSGRKLLNLANMSNEYTLEYNNPSGICLQDDEYVWVSDWVNERINLHKNDEALTLLTPFKVNGIHPSGMAIVKDALFVCDTWTGTIYKFKIIKTEKKEAKTKKEGEKGKKEGTKKSETGPVYEIDLKLDGEFKDPDILPVSLVWDGRNLWSCDSQAGKIYKYRLDSAISIIKTFDSPVENPRMLAYINGKLCLLGSKPGQLLVLSEGSTILSAGLSFEYQPMKKLGGKVAGLTDDGDTFWFVIDGTSKVFRYPSEEFK